MSDAHHTGIRASYGGKIMGPLKKCEFASVGRFYLIFRWNFFVMRAGCGGSTLCLRNCCSNQVWSALAIGMGTIYIFLKFFILRLYNWAERLEIENLMRQSKAQKKDENYITVTSPEVKAKATHSRSKCINANVK